MTFKPQRIRDPLHDLIEFKADAFDNMLWDVIQTQPFQRLRRVKQLGFSDLVYPGASHSRFAHSVGVFHIARRLMTIIQTHLTEQKNWLPDKAQAALAAALVHDIGHGPFSHAFEEVGKELGIKLSDHETVSEMLIRDGAIGDVLKQKGSGFHNDVADIVAASAPRDIYSAVVSSQFDADRLDYMQRDRLMTGTHHSAIDYTWLISNLEVASVQYGVDEAPVGAIETFVIGPKAIYAAEMYVVGLFQLYPTVYYHKATRGAEKIFQHLLLRLFALSNDGSVAQTGLDDKHPLIAFFKNPESLEHLLSVDDTIVWGALSYMEDADDEYVSEFASRLRNRKLLKSIDVREKIAEFAGSKLETPKFESICAYIEEKLSTWNQEKKMPVPRILTDTAEREPYRRFHEAKGPLNQIRIKLPDGELVDLGERSKVVGAIETFRLFRAYVRRDDQEAHDFVIETIKEGIRENGQ